MQTQFAKETVLWEDLFLNVRAEDGTYWYLPGYQKTVIRISRTQSWERLVWKLIYQKGDTQQ